MNIGVGELFAVAWRGPVALYFAWSDTKARYKRSVLGPFWLVLSTAAGVVGLGVVWSVLLNIDKQDFIPTLTVGLITWNFISSCIGEAPGIFYRAAGQIKDINLPSFFVSLQLIFRQLINLAHNFLVIIVVLLLFPAHLSWVALLAIPGLVVVALNLFWIVHVLGYFGARYRDLEPLVNSFLPVLFFISPVIYRPSQLGPLQQIMAFNPLSYWIQLIRDPLFGVTPSFSVYATAGAMTVAGWLFAIWLTDKRRHRLPFWL